MSTRLSDTSLVWIHKPRPSISIFFSLKFFFRLWDIPLQLWGIDDCCSMRCLCPHKFSSVFRVIFLIVNRMLPKFIRQWFLWHRTSMKMRCSANRKDFSLQHFRFIILQATPLDCLECCLPNFIYCPSQCIHRHEEACCQ